MLPTKDIPVISDEEFDKGLVIMKNFHKVDDEEYTGFAKFTPGKMEDWMKAHSKTGYLATVWSEGDLYGIFALAGTDHAMSEFFRYLKNEVPHNDVMFTSFTL